MSLTETTSQELQELARRMLSEQQNVSSYKEFGTLVKAESPEFQAYEGVLMLGEVTVDGVRFIYFAK